jgi:hypothetical protein
MTEEPQDRMEDTYRLCWTALHYTTLRFDRPIFGATTMTDAACCLKSKEKD